MPAVQRASPSRPTAPDISHAIPVDSTNRPLSTTEKVNPPTTATNSPPQKLAHTDPSAKGAISDSTPKTLLLTKTSSTLSVSRPSIPSTPNQSPPSNIGLHVPASKNTIIRLASQPLSPSRTTSIPRQFVTSAETPTQTTFYMDTKPSSLHSKQSDYNSGITLTETQKTTSQSLPMLSTSPSNRFHGSSITQHSLITSSHTSVIPDASRVASKLSSPPNVLIGISLNIPPISANLPTLDVGVSGPKTIDVARFSITDSSTSMSASNLGNRIRTKTTPIPHVSMSSGRINHTTSTVPTLTGKHKTVITTSSPQGHHTGNSTTTNSSGHHVGFNPGRIILAPSTKPFPTSTGKQKKILPTSSPQDHNTSNSITASSTSSSRHVSINHGTTPTPSTKPLSTSPGGQKKILSTSSPQGHNTGKSITTNLIGSSTHANIDPGRTTTTPSTKPPSTSTEGQKKTLTNSSPQGHNTGKPITTNSINSGTHANISTGRINPTSNTSAKPLPISSARQVISAPQLPNPTKTQETTRLTNGSTPPVRINQPPHSKSPPKTTSSIISFHDAAASVPNLQTSTRGTFTMSSSTLDLSVSPPSPSQTTPVVAVLTVMTSGSLTTTIIRSIQREDFSAPTTSHTTSPGANLVGTMQTSSTSDSQTTGGIQPSSPSVPSTSPSSPSTTSHGDTDSPPDKNPHQKGKSGKNDSQSGMSTGEKEAIIAGSVAAAVSIITLILVLVALLICRRKQRRQRAPYQQQLPTNMINAPGVPGISYIPVFPVTAAPPYQQALAPLNQKAEFQPLEISNDKTHPSFVPVYGDTTQSVDGIIFQNVTPIENFKTASYVDGQGRIYSSHRNQDSAISSDIEYASEERPSSGHVQEHVDVATEWAVQPQRIKSVTSDNSVQFGVAL